MFTYITTYVLVFVLAVFTVFSFYASLSINDFRHSNNLLTSLILSLGDGFYLWDEKKRVERFSPNLQVLLNSIFYSFNELANFFEESEQLVRNFEEARKINKSFTLDLKGRDSKIYCVCYGQSIVDNHDQIVGVLLWIQDVTESRSLISNLKYENERLAKEIADCRDMINVLPYPLWKRLQGSVDAEIYNQFYLKLTRDNKNGSIFSKKYESGSISIKEKLFTIIENERRVYSLTEVPTDAGDLVGYGQDVTQNLHLMKEIKGYSKMQKVLLNSVPCAAALYSSDGKLLYFNEHFRKLWKFERSWSGVGATYSDVIRIIHDRGKFTDDGTLNLLKKQQYELFGKLAEPYYDTLTLKNGTLEISVVPNHRQELLFLYNNTRTKHSHREET